MLFHKVVHLHPVYLHLYGQLALYGLAHPRAFGLHVYEQIVRTVKRILSFLVGLNARNLRPRTAVEGLASEMVLSGESVFRFGGLRRHRRGAKKKSEEYSR